MTDQILKTLTADDGTTVTVLRDEQACWYECSQGCPDTSGGPYSEARQRVVEADAEAHRDMHNNQ